MKRALFAATVAMLAAGLSPSWAETPKQGGAGVVTFSNDLTTLDPQVGYDWQNWSVIKSIFDGLMDYKPGTTELEPDLAESYTVSDDGKTYTFKLRDGLKFHNGRAVTAADVKYSHRTRRSIRRPRARAAAISAPSPAMTTWSAARPPSSRASTAPDDKTVVITLTRPDATFLHLMAINFAYVVPKEEVEKAGADWGKKPVGTGAFKFVEWVPGQRLALERNKDYFRQGVPYLDKLTFEFGQDPTVAVLKLKNGEIDIVGDGIPPAQFAEIMADAANKDLVAVGEQLHTGYVTMNVTAPPFDNVKVRQAVNMAINKERITRMINNRGKPASQALPPAMPGYNAEQKGYAFDPEGAKKLLAEAGHPDGFATEIYAMNVDPNPRIAQSIQQDLAAVGIKAEIKSLAQAEVIAAGGSGKAPMIWSGGMAWIADFPDPANFYYGILGCAGAVEGGWNWSKYCNKDLDARAEKADAMVKADEAAAAGGGMEGRVRRGAERRALGAGVQ